MKIKDVIILKNNSNETCTNLINLICKAEAFVNDDYKNTALQYSTNAQILREIYTCAWDSVPADEVSKVLESTNDARAIRQLRYEFLTDRQLGKSKDKINDINAVMNVLEKKVSSVEKTFKELQQSSTDLQSMFVDNLPPQGALTVDKTPAANTVNNSRVPDMSVSQMKKTGNFKRKRLTRKQKKDIVSYIDLLTSEGYSAAQVGYVLKCAEDGMSPVEIEEFIHPDLSVQMMEQIRVMKNKQKS